MNFQTRSSAPSGLISNGTLVSDTLITSTFMMKPTDFGMNCNDKYEIIDIKTKINYPLLGHGFYSKFDLPMKGEKERR